MPSPWTRRKFLAGTGLVAGGALLGPGALRAVEPFVRTGPPRLRLALAAYSFRQDFRHALHRREAPPEQPIELPDFIDFCARHQCDGAELTSYFFPPEVGREHLLQLRRHAFLRGVTLSGTAVGNTFTHPAGEEREEQLAYVQRWIEHASILGMPHVRIFAGSAPAGTSRAEAKRRCIAAVEACARVAGRHGIFLGLENHGGIVAEAEDLLDIVRSVESPWVGINLDTGNFHTDDPYRDLERCAPYAVNVQLKTEIHPRGEPRQPADLARLIDLLRRTRYQGFVALEYEAAESPWQAVPPLLDRLRALMAE